MMNSFNVQVGTTVLYRSQSNQDLQLSVIVRHVDPNYVVVEHEDGTSSCVRPESIIPQPCLTDDEVNKLYDAHELAIHETRLFLARLPYSELSTFDQNKMKTFAREALRLTRNDFNLLERIVKPRKDETWFNLLGYPTNEIQRQRELFNNGIDIWNRLHPDMPIAR